MSKDNGLVARISDAEVMERLKRSNAARLDAIEKLRKLKEDAKEYKEFIKGREAEIAALLSPNPMFDGEGE